VVEEEVVGSVLADSTCQTWEDLPMKMQASHNQSEEYDSEDRYRLKNRWWDIIQNNSILILVQLLSMYTKIVISELHYLPYLTLEYFLP